MTQPGPAERVLVVGGGGREHALAWACARSPQVAQVYCAPGNPGTAELGENIPLTATDAEGIAAEAERLGVGLAILGPDAAVAAGVADALAGRGVACFGPTAAAGRLESSKAFAKEVLSRLGIPTAPYRLCASWEEARAELEARSGPVVVKADGPALGKGAFVCGGPEEALEVAHRLLVAGELGEAGRLLVVEDRLEGEELSFFALCDGRRALMLPPARDFKSALDGDRGGNTGGMGAYSPPRTSDWERLNQTVLADVVQPVLAEMARLGSPFTGCLYVGAMMVAGTIHVLEFNARFGDPEAEVLLPLLPDLVPHLRAAAAGRLEGGQLSAVQGASVGVVAVRAPYPAPVTPGGAIEGLERLPEGCTAFQMGTRRAPGGGLEVAGGRVLICVGTAPDLHGARALAYQGLERISFPGMRYRSDIAA